MKTALTHLFASQLAFIVMSYLAHVFNEPLFTIAAASALMIVTLSAIEVTCKQIKGVE